MRLLTDLTGDEDVIYSVRVGCYSHDVLVAQVRRTTPDYRCATHYTRSPVSGQRSDDVVPPLSGLSRFP